jgi:hypothetical protein
MLLKLSKIFQQKLVDISSIGSIVKSESATIRMCFVMNSCDLNQDTFILLVDFLFYPNLGLHVDIYNAYQVKLEILSFIL